MIVVLFGQPNSGKTTLGVELTYFIESDLIDGDHLREIFNNTDYSYQGRINNLKRASDIATYMDRTMSNDVILSLVYPYKEARAYLNSISDNVKWIYLEYNETRGREDYHVADFDYPVGEEVLTINTSTLSIDDCVKKIIRYLQK
jgi:adenylylsulfate kinase-like enzyme